MVCVPSMETALKNLKVWCSAEISTSVAKMAAYLGHGDKVIMAKSSESSGRVPMLSRTKSC